MKTKRRYKSTKRFICKIFAKEAYQRFICNLDPQELIDNPLSKAQQRGIYLHLLDKELAQINEELDEFANRRKGRVGKSSIKVFGANFVWTDDEGKEHRVYNPTGKLVYDSTEQLADDITNGRIKPIKNRTARVYGGHSITEDFKMEDFDEACELPSGERGLMMNWKDAEGYYCNTCQCSLEYSDLTENGLCSKCKEKPEYHGGIVEQISQDRFVETMTGHMGNEEQAEFYDQTEIRYGRANSLHNSGLNNEDMDCLTIYSAPIESNDSRGDNERRYYGSILQERLKKGFNTHKELFDACTGWLFPTNYVSKKEVYGPYNANDDIEFIEALGYPRIFLHPANVLSRSERQEFMRQYRDIAEQFREEKTQKIRDGKELLLQIREIDMVGSNLIEAIKSLVTNQDTAWKVLMAARQYTLETKTEALPRDRWRVIQRIAKGDVVDSTDLNEPIAMKKLNAGSSLSKEEAAQVLRYAYAILNTSNRKILTYTQYRTVCARAQN